MYNVGIYIRIVMSPLLHPFDLNLFTSPKSRLSIFPQDCPVFSHSELQVSSGRLPTRSPKSVLWLRRSCGVCGPCWPSKKFRRPQVTGAVEPLGAPVRWRSSYSGLLQAWLAWKLWNTFPGMIWYFISSWDVFFWENESMHLENFQGESVRNMDIYN